MSYKTNSVTKWSSSDFMSFISSLNIKGKPYNDIQKALNENGLSAHDIIKSQTADIKDLFGINIILARKIKKQLVKLNVGQITNPQPSTAPRSNPPSSSSNSSDQFEVHLRGKQGGRVTLRKLFTKNSKISDVAISYKDQECVDLSYKVEKIIFIVRGKTLAHNNTLGYYGIIDSHNLITVIFKTKGGSDKWPSRAVDEWDTNDLKLWVLTLNFEVADEKLIISAITQNGFGGSDLKDAEIEDIADAFEIETQLAQIFHDALRDWKVAPADTATASTVHSHEYIYKAQSAHFDANQAQTLPYFIGYKLDCKDSSNKWCTAEVVAMSGDCITVKYFNWKSSKTESGYYEDVFNGAKRETHCKEYGVMTNKSYLNDDHVYADARKLHPSKKQARAIQDSQKAKLQKQINTTITNGASVAPAILQSSPYFIGCLLDCRDENSKWCVAEVIAMRGGCITVKYINWGSSKTQSRCFEETFDDKQRETRCKEYGIMTSRTKQNYDNVYDKKRRLHPSKKAAKAKRDSQKKQFQTMNNKANHGSAGAQSGGYLNSVTSFFGYNNESNSSSNNYNRHNVSGIIGLVNLGNQCYMNSAIQLIVCTPPLLRLFRSASNAPRKSLLSLFVSLCKKAQYESVYTPSGIKSILAQEDQSSFGNYSQQDSGHALSVLLEKLDRELLNNEVHHSRVANCTFAGGLDKDSEQVVIEKIMDEYNPKHRSVIRDSMTFILRETYKCMTPNCDYFETRYDYVQKLVLPLENHSIRIPVTICSTKASKSIQTEFICLSYCILDTLIVQIHEYLRNEYKKQYTIDLYCMKNNHRNTMNTILDPTQMLIHLDLNQKCEYLVGKSVFVIAKHDNEADDVCMNNMIMKQFYIAIDNKGKVSGFDFNAVTATIDAPVSELPVTISKGIWWMYYQGRILLPSDTMQVQKLCDVMVIIYTKTKNNRWIELAQAQYQNIDPHWKFVEDTFHDNIINYYKVSEGLRSMRQKSNSSRLRNKGVDYMTVDKSLQFAIAQYAKMAQNQKLISKYLKSVLQFACAAKCTQIYPKPLSIISECLTAYFEEQVLDGGASISCAQCSQCKIFKKSTTVVRYPDICTILFDRFDDGRKYDRKVEFHKTMDTICEGAKVEYELYAVCNHRSSSTDFGHYYSFVKSVDNNESVWYEANDRSVSSIRNEKQITDNRNALVLMYQLNRNQSMRM